MKSTNLTAILSMFCVLMAQTACSPSTDSPFNNGGLNGGMENMGGPGGMGGGTGSVSDDGASLGIDNSIKDWDGTTAMDASKDTPGNDSDIYYEANTFSKKVTVTFNGSSASVVPSDASILYHTSGAYVTLDMATNSVSGVEIELKGSSDDGGLKIYGDKKFKLTLNGLSLHSNRGPAINSQCKKRIFLNVASGTENTLTDVATYTDDPYYLDASKSEDRKGCFFSEGNVIMSGTGLLKITGLYKHALVTDNSFIMRPGANLIINGAAKNGLHAKGDSDTGIGVLIMGGYIYANISSEAGKGIKTDMGVEVTGGVLDLNTSGNGMYDSSENDTSSAAGIKTDGNIVISGGTISAKSTGSGGKGLNADGEIKISGGEITVATNGSKYVYNKLDSSPKGVKADGNITISGGTLKIAATGRNDGAEGLESKADLTISGGNVSVYAYDDAINAKTAINITDGNIYAYAQNNDGIDSNGSLTISGGTVLASGSSAPEGCIDCDNTQKFFINGGTVFGIGGTLQSLPSSSSSQYCVSYNSFSASKGATIRLLDSSSQEITSFEMPRTVSGGNLLLSSSALKSNAQYTVTNGTQTLFTFTTSSRIISVN